MTKIVDRHALPYERPTSRVYGEPAGIRLLTALEQAGRDPFTTADAVAEGTALGLSRGHTLTLLHHLAAGAWLTRLKKGVYAINDPVSRLPKAHPFAIGAALVSPSAVSHWSALSHWALTEQIPLAVTLSSPTRTFPPTATTSAPNGHPAWTVDGVHYTFITVTPDRWFGITRVWVNERNQVPMFDRERALLDAFQHFQIFGSLGTALTLLEEHRDHIDLPRLVQYAVELGVAAVVKRVGWVLDRLGVAPEILAPLRTFPARGDAPLDPGRPARGRHDPTWHVIENLRDDR